MMTFLSQRSSGMRAIGLIGSSNKACSFLRSRRPLVRVPGLVDRVRREAFEVWVDRLRLTREPDEVFRQVRGEQLLDRRVRALPRVLVVRTQRRALRRVHRRIAVAEVVHAVRMRGARNVVAREQRVVVGIVSGDPAEDGEVELAGRHDAALAVGREEEVCRIRLDLRVDPDRAQHRLDLHGDFAARRVLDVVGELQRERLPVLSRDSVGPRRPAGLREQRLRFRRIRRIPRDVRLVGPRVRRLVGPRDRGAPGGVLVHQGLLVDGVCDGAPNAHVAQRGVRGVHPERERLWLLVQDHGDPRHPFELLVELRRGLEDPVDVVRAQRVQRGVLVGDLTDDDPAQLRLAAEVVVVRDQRDVIAARPLRHLERSRANRHLIERHLVEALVLREQVLRDDADRVVRLREHRVDERRELAFEMEDDGRRVRRVDARDLVVADALVDVVGVVHHRLPAELHVLAAERHAVLPAHAGVQVVRDRQAVFADPAVTDRRHGGRQDGDDVLSAAVDADERVEAEPVEEAFGGERREDRVERVRLALDRDAQHAVDRAVRTARSGGRACAARGPLADLRARAEGQRARERADHESPQSRSSYRRLAAVFFAVFLAALAFRAGVPRAGPAFFAAAFFAGAFAGAVFFAGPDFEATRFAGAAAFFAPGRCAAAVFAAAFLPAGLAEALFGAPAFAAGFAFPAFAGALPAAAALAPPAFPAGALAEAALAAGGLPDVAGLPEAAGLAAVAAFAGAAAFAAAVGFAAAAAFAAVGGFAAADFAAAAGLAAAGVFAAAALGTAALGAGFAAASVFTALAAAFAAAAFTGSTATVAAACRTSTAVAATAASASTAGDPPASFGDPAGSAAAAGASACAASEGALAAGRFGRDVFLPSAPAAAAAAGGSGAGVAERRFAAPGFAAPAFAAPPCSETSLGGGAPFGAEPDGAEPDGAPPASCGDAA